VATIVGMVGISLRLSGIPALLGPAGALALLDRHGALLAARLALEGAQTRGELAALLWPELPPERARANLRQRLLRLRALTGSPWIAGQSVLRLAPEVTVLPWQDRAHGELLQGVDEVESPVLLAWLNQRRGQCLQDRAVQWQGDIDQAEAGGQIDAALHLAHRWLATDPRAEAPYRSLARLHYLQHDMARAAAVLQRLRAMLQAEFGAQPSPATEALHRAVQAASAVRVAMVPVSVRPLACLLHPPVVVGRDDTLAQLARQWHGGGLTWVTGEPGIGTSRVLAAWCAQPAAGRVLRVEFRPTDAEAPRAGWQRCLSALHALGVEGMDCLDRSGVTGVVLDQLHDAHPDSQLALLAAAEASGVPWLLGARSAMAHGAVGERLRRLEGARRLLCLPLAPLTPDAVTHLLQTLATPAGWGPLGEQATQSLVRHTGGHPWYLLQTLVEAGAPPWRGGWPTPARVVAALTRQWQALAPSARRLAQVLAVADRHAGPAAVAAALGRTVLALADDWRALEAAHLVHGTTLAHELARQALLQTLPAAVAAELHQALAMQLERAHDGHRIEPAHLAWHWQAAGRPGQALAWWLRAADLAHDELRPMDEAAHLSQAVAAVEAVDPPRALSLLLRLARVEADAQGLGASLPTLERALRMAGDGPQRATVLRLLAEAQLNRLMPEASARSAEQALQLAAPHSPEAAEAVVRLHKARCLAGQSAAAERLWQQHQAWLTPDRLPSAELVSDRAWVLDRLGRHREAMHWHAWALQRACAAERPVDEAVVLGNQAQGLLLAGRPAEAIHTLDLAAAAAARHQGLHEASNYNHVGRASAEHLRGHYETALAGYDSALADAFAQSLQAALTIRLRRAVLWADIGQPARALADLAPVLLSTSLPAWTLGRARALAIRLSPQPVWMRLQALQALLASLDDAGQLALDAPLRLQCVLWMGQAGEADAGWHQARRVLRQAVRARHPGLRWAAHWAAAQLALAAGRHLAARRHAAACAARPADDLGIDVPEGRWWHALWVVWQSLGEPERANAARAAGRAWVQQVLEHALPLAHQASFVNAVPAHAALLAS